MDFHKLIVRFRQFGGAKLVWQYARLGALPIVLRGLWRFTVKGSRFKYGVFQCCKGLYGDIIKKVEPVLVAKYSHIVQKNKNDNLHDNKETNTDCTNDTNGALTSSATIWFCWLQGL